MPCTRTNPWSHATVASETRFEIPSLLLDHGVKSMINVIIPGGTAPFGVLEVDGP